MTTPTNIYLQLERLDACSKALNWVQDTTDSHENCSSQDLWYLCHRGDWMLWLLAQTKNTPRQSLVLAGARCAGLVVHLMTDERSRVAVAVAKRYGLGLATKEELANVANAANAAYAAVATGSAEAAVSAAIAAAAAAAANAEAAAVSAANAAANAANASTYAATYAAAKNSILLQCANIVRTIFPNSPL